MKRSVVILLLLFIYVGVSAPSLTKEQNLENSHRFYVQMKVQDYFQRKHVKTLHILATIRQVESSNRYHVYGQSGEYGAYQFVPATWARYSREYSGEILNIYDPKVQDRVAYYKVQQMLNKGYEIEQIAATWNSGSPTGWENKIGINRYGVKYNVPKYVEKFVSMYNDKFYT